MSHNQGINIAVWVNYGRNRTGASKGTVNETDPTEVDFNHKPSMIMHTSFGSGSDTRPGALLARRGIMVFFEDWMEVILDFELDPDEILAMAPGSVNGVLRLPLRWNV